MAPGIAALAGIGGVMLYRAFREGSAAKWAWVLPAAIAVSTVWAVVLLQRVSGSGTIYTVAEAVTGVAGAVAVTGLLLGRFTKRHRLMGVAALAAVVALLAGPAAYSVSAATSSTNGTNPTAGPNTGGMGGGMGGGGQRPSGSANSGSQSMGQPPSGSAPSGSGSSTGTSTSGSAAASESKTAGGGMGGDTQVSSAMISYLKKNQDGATWLVAVATDQTASSIILESGEPVISMGGWSGSDNAMTLAKLKSLVKSGKLHYIVISSSGQGSSNSEISTWVKKNGTAVSAYSGLYRLG
jgi:4-amino-4-deoxy-L-arabinose transferase-like glycosyltransferase